MAIQQHRVTATETLSEVVGSSRRVFENGICQEISEWTMGAENRKRLAGALRDFAAVHLRASRQ